MVGQSAPFPSRPFTLYDSTTLTRQETANNRSLVHFEVAIRKDAYSPTFANAPATAYASWGYNGNVIGSNNPGAFDFRAAGPWLWVSGDVWIPHNADGSKTINVNVSANFSILGSTGYTYGWTLPTIARFPPPAPTALSLEVLDRNTMRYRFQSNGDGGSPILRWEAQYSTTPDFSSGTSAWFTSTGTSVVNTLKPGTRYWWRSRGVNAAGTGATSNVLNARTYSGAWISDGTQWLPANVVISDGTKWLPANVDISNGSSWKPTG